MDFKLYYFDSRNSNCFNPRTSKPSCNNKYVISSFDNLQDGWDFISKEIADEINTHSCLPMKTIVLHDTGFEIEIMKRAVESCAEHYFGLITEEELDKRLGKNGNFNGYLLDFKFNHFSEAKGKLYISRLNSNRSQVCNQTLIAEELMNIHDFPTLVDVAIDFIDINKEWLEKQDKKCIPELVLMFEDITREYLASR